MRDALERVWRWYWYLPRSLKIINAAVLAAAALLWALR